MFTVTCIKCRSKYEDEEPEAYYCPNCQAEKSIIAEEINKRLLDKDPNQRTPSMLDQLQATPSVKIGGRTFYKG